MAEEPVAGEVAASEVPRVAVLDDAEPEPEPAGAETPPPAAGEPAVESPDAGAEPDTSPKPEPGPTPTATKGARGRKQRPSVPSWDDIMFGAKRD